jgi:hypothetical protein
MDVPIREGIDELPDLDVDFAEVIVDLLRGSN